MAGAAQFRRSRETDGADNLGLARDHLLDSDQAAGGARRRRAVRFRVRAARPRSARTSHAGDRDRHRRLDRADAARHGIVPPVREPGRVDRLAVRPLPDRQQRLRLQHGQRVQPLRDQADVLAVGPAFAPAVRHRTRRDVDVGRRARARCERTDRRALPARAHRPGVSRGLDARRVRVLHAGHADARTLYLRRVLAGISAHRLRAPANLDGDRALVHDAAQPDLLVRLSDDDGDASAGHRSDQHLGCRLAHHRCRERRAVLSRVGLHLSRRVRRRARGCRSGRRADRCACARVGSIRARAS